MRWYDYSICCVFTQREAQVKQLERGRGPTSPGSHRLGPQAPKWLGKPDWPSPENALFTTLSWASKPGVSGGVLKRHKTPLLKAETAETLQRSKDKTERQGKETGARKQLPALECPFPNTPCINSGENGTCRWLWQKRGEFKKSRKNKSTSHQKKKSKFSKYPWAL